MDKSEYSNPTNRTIYITLTSGEKVSIPPFGRVSIDPLQVVKDAQFSSLLSSGVQKITTPRI